TSAPKLGRIPPFLRKSSGGDGRPSGISRRKIGHWRRAMMALRKLARIGLLAGVVLMPFAAHAQTLAQLLDGAKKEGQLVLSWGTGTMGGIEGAQAMEKAFNKKYGLNLPFKFSPGPAMRSSPAELSRKKRPASRRAAICSSARKITWRACRSKNTTGRKSFRTSPRSEERRV